MDIKNKLVLITGGAKGIGLATAQRILNEGGKVILWDFKEDDLNKSVNNFKEQGFDVFSQVCDVTNKEQVYNNANIIKEKFGGIDILINNAAGNFISPTENLSSNAFKTVVDIVLNGTFHCTQSFGKHMRKMKNGVILNIVTTYAWTGSGYVVPSACAKAGVLAMTRSLAVEWAKYGIRSNAIAPGPFPTKGAWSRLAPPGLGIEKKMKNLKYTIIMSKI